MAYYVKKGWNFLAIKILPSAHARHEIQEHRPVIPGVKPRECCTVPRLRQPDISNVCHRLT